MNYRWHMVIAGLLFAASGIGVFASGNAKFSGDLDGDGYADLAIGVPGDEAVHVMYGSSSGVSDRDLILEEGHSGLPGTEDSMAAFGSAIAMGDFNGDTYEDVAIGAPGQSVTWTGHGTQAGAGAVVIVYGDEGGLDTHVSLMFTQDTSGIAYDPEPDDRFGSSVATGDFNKDGYADLAIGVPFEDVKVCTNYVRRLCTAWTTYVDAGVVHVLYGSTLGLSSVNSQIWYQDDSIEGSLAANDHFGWVVVAGDFDGDGYDEAAIGAPGDLASDTGAVNILYGSASRLTATDNKRLYGGTTGDAEDVPHEIDMFGSSLAAGDFNADGKDDLAVGIPGQNICDGCTTSGGGGGLVIYPEYNAGAATVFYGSSSGLDSTSSRSPQFWYQNSTGISGGSEDNDWFGYSVVAGDFDGDRLDDLAVGVPGEAVGVLSHAGAVNVLYGAVETGLGSNGEQIWHQDTSGIEGAAEEWDEFGFALAAGDFNGDGRDDLAVGVPYEFPNGDGDACDDDYQGGAVNIIYALPNSTSGLNSSDNECWERGDPGIQGDIIWRGSFGAALASAASGPSHFEEDHSVVGCQVSVPFPFNLFD